MSLNVSFICKLTTFFVVHHLTVVVIFLSLICSSSLLVKCRNYMKKGRKFNKWNIKSRVLRVLALLKSG